MSGMWIGIGIAAAGMASQVYGQQQGKKAAKADAAAIAAQQREAAARSRALGQRQAAEERKQARLVTSALQARAGGGGTDPGVLRLDADIYGEGELRALQALYEGDTGALSLENAANAGLRSGRARARGYDWQTAGSIVKGGSAMYSRYADSPPPTSDPYAGGWTGDH